METAEMVGTARLSKALAGWGLCWDAAVAEGKAEPRYGAEWQAALGRFLLMSQTQRESWLGRPGAWRITHVHVDTVPVPGAVTREEKWRAEVEPVVRAWGEACVEVTGRTGPEGDTVAPRDVEVSFATWLAFTERERFRELPGSLRMKREVLREHLLAAGATWDGKARVFVGVRLV
jgi:hypothetical protein